MTQDAIEVFLKGRVGERYAADELQRFLGLGSSLYTNLSKLRTKCKCFTTVVKGGKSEKRFFTVEGDMCLTCGVKAKGNVRCVKGQSYDARGHTYFYWWSK